MRLYSDPLVADVILAHYEEKILDVLSSEWLMHEPVQQQPRTEHVTETQPDCGPASAAHR
jgi:hypothetical protein